MNDAQLPPTGPVPDPDDELGEALGRAIADHVETDAVAPPVVTIRERAAERARRRKTMQTGGSIAAAAIVLAGGVFGWSALRDDEQDSVATVDVTDDIGETVPDGDGEAAGAPDGPAPDATEAIESATDAGGGGTADFVAPEPADLSTGPALTWTAIAGPSGGNLQPLDDGRVALLEWGVDGGSSSILVTADGLTWEALPGSADLDIFQFAADGDRWVVVGVDPGSVDEPGGPFGEPDSIAAISRDGGRTWTRLELTPSGVVSDGYLRTGSYVQGVAVSGDVVVVGVGTFQNFDIERYLRDEGLGPDEIEGYSYGYTDGEPVIEVDLPGGTRLELGPDDLGVTAEEYDAFFGGEGEGTAEVYASVGDGDLERVLTAGSSNIQLDLVGEQFIVTTWSSAGPAAFTSTDGVTWTGYDGSGPFDTVGPLSGSFDGSEWSGTYGSDGFEITRTDDGLAFEVVAEFPGLVPGTVVAGPSGIVAGAQVDDPTRYDDSGFEEEIVTPDVSIFKDGYELRFNEPEGGLSLYGPDGELVRAFTAEEAEQDEAPDGVEVNTTTGDLTFFDPETGEELVAVTQDELEQAFGEAEAETSVTLESGTEVVGAVEPEGLPPDDRMPETWVGWSTNGVDWGWQRTTEAFGLDAGVDHWVQYAVGDGFVLAGVEIFQPATQPVEPGDDWEPPQPLWFIADVD